jgi:Family of unknown function (DUF6011)
MELQEKIVALEAALTAGKLNGSADFARNLINGYRRFGNLTPKQLPWVDNLLARAEGKENPTAALENFSGVYSLFQRAKVHLKYPKITLLFPDGGALKLYLSGPRSKMPDTVNLVEPTAVGPERAWYGRVLADGRFTASAPARPILDKITAVLNRLAREPEKVAAEYGKLTGNCCFCSLPLSDSRSLAVGYGPVCAEHYGLAWGEKSAPTIEEKVGIVAKGTPMQRRVSVRGRRAA